MSKPLNIKDGHCSPVSSNCVIWAGNEVCDNIPLCLGDSVTDVLTKVMERVCEIDHILTPGEYEIPDCVGGTCGIQSFTIMINRIMNRLCEINELVNNIVENNDTEVLNGKITIIDNEAKSLRRSIETLNGNISNIESRCINIAETSERSVRDSLNGYVSRAEYDDNINTLSGTINSSVSRSDSVRRDLGSSQSVNRFGLNISTGDIPNRRMLSQNNIYSNDINWVNNPSGLADYVENLYVVTRDILNATSVMFAQFSGTDCSAIDLNVVAVANSFDSVTLTFSGNVPLGFTDSISGSTIMIYERNNAIPMTINNVNIIEGYYRTNTSYTISLTNVSAANGLTIRVLLRTTNTNTGSSCERIIESVCAGANSCPALMVVPSYNSATYSFAWPGEHMVIYMEVFDSTGLNLLTTLSINANTTYITGTISMLEEGTQYKIRLVINNVPCTMYSFTTAQHPCLETDPNDFNYDDHIVDDPSGLQTGYTIGDWINDYINQ